MVGGLKGSYPKHYAKTFQSTKYFPVDATPVPNLSRESSRLQQKVQGVISSRTKYAQAYRTPESL